MRRMWIPFLGLIIGTFIMPVLGSAIGFGVGLIVAMMMNEDEDRKKIG